MAVVKNLMVRAGADFSAITKQANKASQSMRGMQASVSHSCDLMSKAASGLKRTLGAIGVGLSVAGLVNLAKEAASAYDEQASGEMRLAAVMRNTMHASNAEIQSIMDLTAAQQQLGIVGDEVQLAGAQELATYLSLKSSLEALIPVMNDMAVQQYGYNVTAEQTASIATMLGKVMEGQVSGLSRYGYYFDAAQEKVLKYGTEAERAAMLAEVVGQSVGGMNAALAATPTGRMQQLSNALGDIKEQFGQAVRTVGTVFLPVLNAVGSALAGIATMANKVAQAIANVFGGSVAGKEWQWGGIAAGVSETADAVDDLTDAQNGSAGAAKKQAEALQAASFDTLNILRATDSSGGGGGAIAAGGGGGGNPITETQTAADDAGDSVSWLQSKLENLKAVWEDFRAKLDFTKLKEARAGLKEAVSSFATAIEKALGAVWTRYLEPLAVWTINKALPATLGLVAEAVKYVAEKITDLASLIGGDMSFGEFISKLNGVETALLGVAAAAGSVKLISGSVTAFKLLSKTGSEVTGVFGALIQRITSVSGPIQNLHQWFKLAFGGVTTLITGIAAVIGGLTTAVASFVSMWQNGWSTIKTILEAVGLALAAVGAVILGAPVAVAAAVAAVVFAVSQGAILLHDHWDDVKRWVSEIPDWFREHVIAPIVNGIKATGDDVRRSVEIIKSAISNVRDAVTVGVQNIKTGMNEILSKIKSQALAIYNSITGYFSKAYTTLSGIIERIKGLLNFSWSFPKPTIPHFSVSWTDLGKWGSLPHISVDWYARGGVFDTASLIGVGEAGKEAVVPLERNTGWITKVASDLAAQMASGQNMYNGDTLVESIQEAVYEAMMAVMGTRRQEAQQQPPALYLNGRELVRGLWDDLAAVSRERGGKLINA